MFAYFEGHVAGRKLEDMVKLLITSLIGDLSE